MSDEPTKDELYERAQELDIEGRSAMDKEELAQAIAEAEAEPQDTGAEEPAADEDELPVSEVEASVDPEGHLADGATVNEDGEVEAVAPESISSEDGGETEVLSGDVEPEALNSGDELPAHRRAVEGV